MKTKTHMYLDYNATAPVRPEVVEALMAALGQPANPSSIHQSGREARKRVEEARAAVTEAVGASEAYQVVFTASGTEANNLALQGFPKQVVRIVSAVEHASVLKAYREVTLCPVDEKGLLRLDALQRLLEAHAGEKALVSVQLANNETGIIQPVAEIAQLVYAHNGYVHCDAAQAVGKIPVDIQALNVDMLTVSAHKFGGPLGAAALVMKKGLPLQAFISGGGQETGFRAGTENVPAIAGFGVAANLLPEHQKAMEQVVALRDTMEKEITQAGGRIIGKEAARLPNTSIILMPGMNNETQLISFDLEGIAVSAGAACSSGKVEVSHVLRAMGLSNEEAVCAIRVSLGPQTTTEEISRFVQAWQKIHARAQAKKKAA